MEPVRRDDLLEFQIDVADFAAKCDAKTKDELEWFSALLHNNLEIAMGDYATDEGIEDYEPQY